MAHPDAETATNLFRLQAAVHEAGSVWAVESTLLNDEDEDTAIVRLPNWCGWEGNNADVIFAAIKTNRDAAFQIYSTRPKSDYEMRYLSRKYTLGSIVLMQDSLCYDSELSTLTETVYGLGAFPQGEQHRVVARDTGSTALLTVVLTNMPTQFDISSPRSIPTPHFAVA